MLKPGPISNTVAGRHLQNLKPAFAALTEHGRIVRIGFRDFAGPVDRPASGAEGEKGQERLSAANDDSEAERPNIPAECLSADRGGKS
jgi:hypothetical protein